MPTITVSPDGAGRASIEVAHSGSDESSWPKYHWTSYNLNAIANQGWTFSHFVIYWRSVDIDGSITTGTETYVNNPKIGASEYTGGHDQESRESWPPEWGYHDTSNTFNAVAVFIRNPNEKTITTIANATAGGIATVTPNGTVSGIIGTTISFTFVAVPSAGYRLKQWSDGSTDLTHVVSDTFGPDDKTISLTAEFELCATKYTVSVSEIPQNSGTSSGDGEYDDGDVCTIDTQPKCSPWTFSHWMLSPGGRINTKQHQFEVTQNTICVAYYTHSNTGLPYYDADGRGEILCSKNGSILYDGDSV